MRDIDVAAIVLCLIAGVLLALRSEFGRKRLAGYADLPWHVRLSIHGLAVFFAARAWRIFTGYGEADASEIMVYGGLVWVLVLQLQAMIQTAWCNKLAEAETVIAAVPEQVHAAVVDAVHESTPAIFRQLSEQADPYPRLNINGETKP